MWKETRKGMLWLVRIKFFRKIFVAKCRKGMTLLEHVGKANPSFLLFASKNCPHGFENLGRADIPQNLSTALSLSLARLHPLEKIYSAHGIATSLPRR